MLFLQYPKCTTCQRAKRWLDERNMQYTDRHIKENPPTFEELRDWYGKSGLPCANFLTQADFYINPWD